jgi:hypothetical protein
MSIGSEASYRVIHTLRENQSKVFIEKREKTDTIEAHGGREKRKAKNERRSNHAPSPNKCTRNAECQKVAAPAEQ